jgi:hypothetical protein
VFLKKAILVNFSTKTNRKLREPQKHGCFANFSVLMTTRGFCDDESGTERE